MSGMYFIICIPTQKYEINLRNESVANIEDSPGSENSKSSKSVSSYEKDKSEEILSDTCSDSKEPTNEANLPLEKVLLGILQAQKISNAVWSLGKDKLHKQVTFCVASGRPCEETLRLLTENGIGIQANSFVSVIPCSLYYQGDESCLSPRKRNLSPIEVNEDDYCRRDAPIWAKFIDSARPRIMLAQVVQNIKTNAEITFDSLVMLIIAALLAALALAENSVVILVSSMVISPLMGPIMAVMFGTEIKDRKLQKMGILNELFGMLLCVIIGFLFGLSISLLGGTIEHIGSKDWPTEEMISRGAIRSLGVGVMVALLSGAAVSIAVLGDYTGSVIGAAISVSLLPPAVNAGLLWSFAVVNLLIDSTFTFSKHYTPLWSSTPNVELAILGGISICLAVVNIICIFIAGIGVLKLKAVTPSRSRISNNSHWNPIKLAKNYKTFTTEEENQPSDSRHGDENRPMEECPEWRRRYTLGDTVQFAVDLSVLHQLTWPASDMQSILQQGTMRPPFDSRRRSSMSGHLSQIWSNSLNEVDKPEDTPQILSSSLRDVKPAVGQNRKVRFTVAPTQPLKTTTSTDFDV